MEFKPGINFRITGTIKRMEVLERGNCLVTISTSAEGQMRDVRIRFFEVAKVLLYRVRDRIQVDAHMQIRRSMQGDRRVYRPELIGDTVTLIQRRLSSAMENNMDPQEMMNQQADTNWGLVEGTVSGLYSPNDKATILSVTVPHREREQRCPISCLGRFKSIADQLKEGDRIAATVYVSVREADENHPFSQNLVCTDLYKFKEEEPEPAVEAAHATEEPEE